MYVYKKNDSANYYFKFESCGMHFYSRVCDPKVKVGLNRCILDIKVFVQRLIFSAHHI